MAADERGPRTAPSTTGRALPPAARGGPARLAPVASLDRIIQGGRAKAYRPLPAAERARAVRRGLAAYRRGDYFEAHELLEPAWLGSPDLAERDLLSGLIKLAAAYVHAARGNPLGVLKNLRGARERLERGASAAAETVPIDLVSLLPAVDDRIRRLEAAIAHGRAAPRRVLRAPRLNRGPTNPTGAAWSDPASPGETRIRSPRTGVEGAG